MSVHLKLHEMTKSVRSPIKSRIFDSKDKNVCRIVTKLQFATCISQFVHVPTSTNWSYNYKLGVQFTICIAELADISKLQLFQSCVEYRHK